MTTLTPIEQDDDDMDFAPLGAVLDGRDRARNMDLVAARLSRGVHDGGPRLTDSGNAERWVGMCGTRFRFHATRGTWFRWTGVQWREDAEGEAELATKDVARDYLVEAVTADSARDRLELVKHANKSESAGARSAMLKLAAAEPGMSVSADRWDTDPWALNALNGVVDLRTGTLRPHQSADLFTKLAPVKYVAGAQCPRFLAFLEAVLPDADVRDFVQRSLGYALTGVIREHVLPIWYGTGRNGKGTLINAINAALGDYAKPVRAEMLMRKGGNSDAHPTEQAGLMGLRLAFASETEAGRALSESVVKMLTGGDPIQARFMRQDFFEFLPTHKIVLLTNHKPVIKGTDVGIWSRVRLVPFVVSFLGREDTGLGEALLAEAEGILAWVVQGCLKWQACGLGSAAAIDMATAGYRDESDVLGQFLADCTVESAGARAQSSDLYKAYRSWCEEQGETPWTQKSFTRALGERDRRPVKSDGVMVFKGLGILADRGSGRNGASGGVFPVNSSLRNSPRDEPEKRSLSLQSSLLPGLVDESLSEQDDDSDIIWGGR